MGLQHLQQGAEGESRLSNVFPTAKIRCVTTKAEPSGAASKPITAYGVYPIVVVAGQGLPYPSIADTGLPLGLAGRRRRCGSVTEKKPSYGRGKYMETNVTKQTPRVYILGLVVVFAALILWAFLRLAV